MSAVAFVVWLSISRVVVGFSSSSSFPRSSVRASSLFDDDAVGTCSFDLAPAAAAARDDDEDFSAVDEDFSAVFELLADSWLLVDPSRGSCCRNACNGCSFHTEVDGETRYESTRVEIHGIVPYVETSVPPAFHQSRWSKLLFAEGSRVGRDAFLEKVQSEALWLLLADGAAAITPAGVVSRIKATIATTNNKALLLPDFTAALLAAKAAASEEGGEDCSLEYESMSPTELRSLCLERGIAKPPPVPRLLLEELRFFDRHGRPGKRNRATRLLE